MNNATTIVTPTGPVGLAVSHGDAYTGITAIRYVLHADGEMAPNERLRRVRGTKRGARDSDRIFYAID